jgi:hypothetical protein
MPPETEAQIAHHIPGRLRLIVPGLKEDADLAERLGRELADIKEIVSVTIRPAARSVLVRYQPNGRDEITASLAGIVKVVEVPSVRPARSASDGTIGETAAVWTHERWDRLNQGLKRGTDGAVDLATVIPLFHLFLAAHQILKQPNLAAIPWYTALYYAYQSFHHYYQSLPPERRPRPRPNEEEEMGPE